MNALLQNNIYVLPLEEKYGRNDLRLVYAPVAGNMMIASEEECKVLEEAVAAWPDCSEELHDVVEALVEGVPADQRDSKVNSVDEFLLMYVLPNYICNFSCSYCYSAKGRSNKAGQTRLSRRSI